MGIPLVLHQQIGLSSSKSEKRETIKCLGGLLLMENQPIVEQYTARFPKSKELYEKVGGFNEENLKVAFNDVDFCLRLAENGYLNIYTPYSRAYHHESLSRGYELSPEQISRFQKEQEYMKIRHNDILSNGDPYYSPNLTLYKEDFSYNV